MKYVLLLSVLSLSLGVGGCRTINGAVYDTRDILTDKSGDWGRSSGSFTVDE